MKHVFSILLIFFLASPADAAKVEGKGREWLDEHKDAPQINVTGTWQSPDWGTLILTQPEGSRDVSGSDSQHRELTGVASGRALYLLFANSKGTVAFCATLVAESDNVLTGDYSYRVTVLKLGHGLCQGKSYHLRMAKSPAAATPHELPYLGM